MFLFLVFIKIYVMVVSVVLVVILVLVLMGYFICGKVLFEYKNLLNWVLIVVYMFVLKVVFNYFKIILVLVLVVMVIGFWLVSKIGSEFILSFDEGDLMYMFIIYFGLFIGKVWEILQQMDKLIVIVLEVKSVFGKIGCVEMVIDLASLIMIEMFIQFKLRDEWCEGMIIDLFKKELDVLVKFFGLINVWVMLIKICIDMLVIGIKILVGIKVVGFDFK